MSNQLSLPTTQLDGIGERYAGYLRGAGVHTVGDLLRVTPGQVHESVSDHVSLQRAQSWCAMAALLQVQSMTPRWAAALQQAGFAGPGDFRYRRLPDVQEILSSSRDPVVPDEETNERLYELVKDAMIIANSGALSGTIVDEEDEVVSHATVRVGNEEAVTDDRGRFRIIRIPLSAQSTLFVNHPRYHSAWFQLARVLPSVAVYTLSFQVIALPGGTVPDPTVLMEVRGDRLPPVGGSRIATRLVDIDDLLQWDILTVVDRSADNDRVRLVSKLLVWEDGRFWLPYAWFPASEVPASEPGACYVVRGQRIEPIQMNPARLTRWIGMLRVRKEAGTRPSEPAQIEEWVATVGNAIGSNELGREERF
jgi:Domain of unknown function (DUF4332)